ncbi:MAG TPA: type IV toxin-antitoxin system AbiEi family antitoxin domain-containing protein [Opitutaceae bacterium]|nr:type IV toxin-antitoxin system AbiEi family antitoxin domain-containing protein [Lacunisphaera sp.]HWA09162.1 type IV toxin-antitoxin system AbiEi family antitoxin domain-containing protein [Opitutaceae bacterium]
MTTSVQKRLRSAFRGTTLLRSRDLTAQGFNRAYLRQAVQAGLLERAGRGLYRPPEAGITEHHTLAEIGKRIPHGVVCLLSALRFHGLTSQSPHEIWLALDHKAWGPRRDGVELRIVRFSGPVLHEGVDTHTIEGVPVHVYNPAKTVADCFKFRHKIGLDVALEALRETWRARRATMKDLEHYARVDRVARVMSPYLASLT